MPFDERACFGALPAVSDERGALIDLAGRLPAHAPSEVLVAVATDLLALPWCPPARAAPTSCSATRNASACRWGTAGRTAAFFATRQEHVRHRPRAHHRRFGRRDGQRASRMACRRASSTRGVRRPRRHLNPRRRCGEHGRHVRGVSRGRWPHCDCRARARPGAALAAGVTALGVAQENAHYFDTRRFTLTSEQTAALRTLSSSRLNLRYIGETGVGVSFDETILPRRRADADRRFAKAVGRPDLPCGDDPRGLSPALGADTSPFLTPRCSTATPPRRR